LSKADPYDRPRSIHNGVLLYNHSQPWVSHVSLQSAKRDGCEYATCLEATTDQLRAAVGKPIVWDEVRYEGNLPCHETSGCVWGGLSGRQMADRFWWGTSRGVYVGHSEALLANGTFDDAQPLWWAKGGQLLGESPSRIGWLRDVWGAALVQADTDFGALTPGTLTASASGTGDGAREAAILTGAGGCFVFVHARQAGRWDVPLMAAHGASGAPMGTWQLARINYWDMSWDNATLPAGATCVIDGDLFQKVRPDGCNFTLEDTKKGRILTLTLEKATKMTWLMLIRSGVGAGIGDRDGPAQM